MAIDSRTKQQILQETNDVNTTEFSFRTGLDSVVDQVDTTQVHMAADRSITLTGDVTGSVTGLEWNNTTDYDISITTALAAASIVTADIADDAITSAKIADNAVVTAAINNGAVTNAKVASASKRRFTIYDSNGSTVLFQIDGLIPL